MTEDYRQLELRFTHELVDGVRVLASAIGYRAPIFSQMLTSLGGVETRTGRPTPPLSHDAYAQAIVGSGSSRLSCTPHTIHQCHFY